jgi:hypothetical protein
MPRVCYDKLTAKYFKQVIALGNHVHGDGYLNQENIKD